MKKVTFLYIPSVFGDAFPHVTATLEGSWNDQGMYADQWSIIPMDKIDTDDGGKSFRAVIQLDESQAGMTFKWGVRFHQNGASQWAIPSEENEVNALAQQRTFTFSGNHQEETYYLTYCRRLGANKFRKDDGFWGMRFAVWAPNAQNVELVFGAIWDVNDPQRNNLQPGDSLEPSSIAGGYIGDDHSGINHALPVVPLQRNDEGIWETPRDAAGLGDLAAMNHRPYMYRITRSDGSICYRTDIYSRCQIGYGGKDPATQDPKQIPYTGLLSDLEGKGSCSVTVDPEKIVAAFREDQWPEHNFISPEEFWQNEFSPDKPMPQRVEDLIIYELHLGALGFHSPSPGTLADAMQLLDHLEALNINTIELLPLSEFGGGGQNWGYATSHYFAIEYGGGGRDQFKHFIRACHQRGIAVIMDVVYNHFDHNADRAERYYDSPEPEKDIYYWYEGNTSDYRYLAQSENEYWRNNWFRGGYIDNMSTGDSPRFWEEKVRKLFISSAISLIREFHLDGFRLDQTTSMHAYNKVRADGREASHANLFGGKFLREFGRTMRLFKPDLMLMAEDHSEWGAITEPVATGGMGFDAKWYSEFYHHLAGDTNSGGVARLLRTSAQDGPFAPLQMDWFSGALSATQHHKVVYNESHDEAGNSSGPFYDHDWNGTDHDKQYTSHRTIVVASNAAPLVGATRHYAEARCRFAWGITVLSAGTPMFLFGEEVGAVQRFKYDAVLDNKDDIHSLRENEGAKLYRFYSDINALRRQHSALRSRNIEIVHVHNSNRIIAFIRYDESGTFLILASLNDQAFTNGYSIHHDRIGNGDWKEVFNSDASLYGGDNIGNSGNTLRSQDGTFNAIIPFAGLVVFQRQG